MEKQIVQLGESIASHGVNKDAIHIAVFPATAAEKLHPGDRVELVNADGGLVREGDNPIGIVDPFLKKAVHPGERFWVLMNPYTITSLRHEWTHPAFDPLPPSNPPPPADRAASEKWMREFAERACLSYEEVLKAAKEYLEIGTYYTQYDSESAKDAMWESGMDNFWDHYEVIAGRKVGVDERESFFSCSC